MRRGFTILEIVLSIVLITSAAVLIFGLINVASDTFRVANQTTIEALILQQVSSELMNGIEIETYYFDINGQPTTEENAKFYVNVKETDMESIVFISNTRKYSFAKTFIIAIQRHDQRKPQLYSIILNRH